MNGSFSFGAPWALLAFVLFPFFLWRLARVKWRNPPAMTYSHTGPLRGLSSGPRSSAVYLPDIIRLLGLAAFVIALARPQIITQRPPEETEGIDIVITLDISRSMLAADFQPSRLHVAKQVIREHLIERSTDRMGLVVFAGEAMTQCPLTLNHRILSFILETVAVEERPTGTAIGNAIGVSLNRLRDSKAKSRVIILLTDGDSNSGNIAPEDAMVMAKNMGVRIYTIQVGSGGLVPVPVTTGPFVDFQQAFLPVNPELLKKIASETGGAYFVADNGEALKNNLNQILSELQKSKIQDTGMLEDREEFYQWPLGAGFALVLLDILLMFTLFRRFP